MTRPMTDKQFQALRGQQLVMVATLYDGSLLIRTQDDELKELKPDGRLTRHTPRSTTRVSLESLKE